MPTSFPVHPAIALFLLQTLGSPLDLQLLDKYSDAWSNADARSRLDAQARTEFGGRGVEIANHFLVHTGPRPRNDAFFFVLRAVGDADTALTLIRALPNPPTHQSGILDRHFGEVSVAIEAVLADEGTRGDPRIVAALERAISTARSKPSGSGRPEALEGVRLMGLCRSAEAARALARLAANGDPEMRAAAAAALGQLDLPSPAETTVAEQTLPANELLRLLVSDSSPAARRQAAGSLGAMDGPAVDAGLRAALGTERDPRVVDGILSGLRRRGAPVDDPLQCRDLVGRTWEADIARQMLDCWLRGGATRDQLSRAALEGGATQRAIALLALTASDALGSNTPIVAESPAGIVLFEPPVRERLLESAVWVLSQGDAISDSTRDAGELALWNLSGRTMDRSIEYADRVTPHTARFRMSVSLARADAVAYDATRRRRQGSIALAIALAFGLLVMWPSRLRRLALLLAAAATGWALWTLQASGVRDLPPPPLQLLSVSALAFFSAGTVSGAAAVWIPRRGHGVSSTIGWFALTPMVAALTAGIACFATRSARLFPSTLDGWELIVDPLGAAIVALVVAIPLLVLDRTLAWPPTAPMKGR